MKKMQVFLQKNSSTILTVVGAAGVVATAVLAVKATPKAMELVEEEIHRQNVELFENDVDKELTDFAQIVKLKPIEVVKVAWKPYVPAIITGVSTIACIFGANVLNKRQQAALMSAYAVLDSSYREYREHAKALNENNSDIDVKREIIKTKFDSDTVLDEDKELFFDYQSMRWFESTFEEVKRAEYVFNQNFAMSGYACVNDFYELIGLEPVEYGYQLGWSTVLNDDVYGESGLEFIYEKTELEDGMECWIITMPCSPTVDYIY